MAGLTALLDKRVEDPTLIQAVRIDGRFTRLKVRSVPAQTPSYRPLADIVPKEQTGYSGKIMEVLSEYERAEDLINIGAYQTGSNKKIDYAVSMVDKIRLFLRQDSDEKATMEETMDSMRILFYV